MNETSFPLTGQRFEVDYGDLKATNAYGEDGRSLTYEITGGVLAGNTETVEFQWHHLFGSTYAISWQEADSSTVVHIDDFEGGHSLAFFTAPDGQFFRLEGSLKPVEFVHQN